MSTRLEELLAEARRRTTPTAKDVPRTFTGFCAWLGVVLTPGQTVMAKVAYDGVQVVDLCEEERLLAHEIFGACGFIPPDRRSVFSAVCGGRGGKSYVMIALRLVWGMYVRDLSSLAPGQHAVALVVAPNDGLRQEVVNYALGAIRSHEGLRATLRGAAKEDTVSGFSIMRPDGHLVDFRAGVATHGGYGGRGKSLTDFAMDESAFFRDASAKVNDKDIFRAASPRVLPGGQSIIASTPWAEAGLLYDLHQQNHGASPRLGLAAHAPTLLLNDREWVRTIVEREYARDPENAGREFGARFMVGGTTVFFPSDLVEQALCTTYEGRDEKGEAIELQTHAGERLPSPGDVVTSGADFGFRSDSAALVISHLSGETRILAELVEDRPSPGNPLKPSITVKKFAERMLAHGSTYLMADGHYRESIDEHLSASDVAYCAAPHTPADAYVRTRMLLREGKIRIPNFPRLIQQIKETQGRPVPGGGMSITHPRWASGGHGDLVAAWVLSVYQLGGDAAPPKRVGVGSKEWEEKEREHRRGLVKAAASSQWWKRGAKPRR